MSQLLDQLRSSGVIDASALESALRRQQIYGGSLDTVLLELELIDPGLLADELAAANRCEGVPVTLLEPGLERPWDALPPEIAALGWIMPLRRHQGMVQVAIHPEIPAEQRVALEHAVEHVQVMVTCEACLAKLAAERSGSVMPQRYAILAQRWIQSLRAPVPAEVQGAAAREAAAPAPWMSVAAETAPYTIPPASAPAPVAPGPVAKAKPSTGQRSQTFLYGLPVSDDDDDTPATGPARPAASERAAAALAERLAGPRSALADAVGRDQATDALARAAMVLSPRVALFGVKREGLRGLDTPGEIAEAKGQVVEVSNKIYEAIEGTRVLDRVTDLDLRIAVGQEMAVPCLFLPVRVHDRPVLMLYVDRNGEPFTVEETEAALELCEVASQTLEEVLRRIRAEPSGAVPIPSGFGRSPAESSGALPIPPVVPPVPEPTPVEPAPEPEDDAPVSVPKPPAIPEVAAPPLPAPPLPTPPPLPSPQKTRAPTLPGAAPMPPSGPMFAAPKATSGPMFTPPRPPSGPTLSFSPPKPPVPVPTSVPASAPPVSAPTSAPAVPAPPVPTSAAPAPDSSPSGKPPVRLHRSDSEASEAPPTPAPPTPSPASILASPFGEPITDDDDDIELVEPEPEAVPTGPGLQALSSPLGSGRPSTGDSIRGRIQLDEEDRPARPPSGAMAEIDAAIQEAMRGSAGAVERLRELGEPAMRRIAKQFPGELDVVRRDLDTLPPLPAHGALIRAALDIGPVLGPHLLALAEHPNPTVRFYIAFVFMELRFEPAVSALGELAFDPDADVRAIAMRVLETYSGEPGFDAAVATIRRELDSPNRTRQLHSTRAVGTVRDIQAVPKLIDLLTSKERYIQEAALESLCSITGQQLGLKPHRWRSWYADNAHHHRVEWIISSLAHKDLSVRRWASDELRRITGQRINFLAAGSKQEREIGIRKWVDWWNEQGRARFGG